MLPSTKKKLKPYEDENDASYIYRKRMLKNGKDKNYRKFIDQCHYREKQRGTVQSI